MFKAGQKIRIMDPDHKHAGETATAVSCDSANDPQWIVDLDDGDATFADESQIIAIGSVDRVSNATAIIGNAVNRISRRVVTLREIDLGISEASRDDAFGATLDEVATIRDAANEITRACGDGLVHGN